MAFRGGGSGRLMGNPDDGEAWYTLVGELLLRRVSSSCWSRASRFGEICRLWRGLGATSGRGGEAGRGVAAINLLTSR